jgi:putative transposase
MPRKPRFFLPGVPVHIVQRGHSREPVFFEDEDYRAYLYWLDESLKKYKCQLHAYVLMTNHIHLLLTPQSAQNVSLVMQYLGRHYVPYINKTYGTSGSIWEGRFKASLVQEENYLLQCMRYIELNPVTASMVKRPEQYQWSSYNFNGKGKLNPILVMHECYRDLGRIKSERLVVYQELFKAHIELNDQHAIKSSLETGTPLGDSYFKEKIEQKLKCKVGYSKRGRPLHDIAVKGL